MKHKYLKNVSTLKIDSEKCIGCGMCENVCPHDVFRIVSRKAEIINLDSCMECGACEKNCPTSALSVKAGVGCAYAIVVGWMTGSEPNCGGSAGGCC